MNEIANSKFELSDRQNMIESRDVQGGNTQYGYNPNDLAMWTDSVSVCSSTPKNNREPVFNNFWFLLCTHLAKKSSQSWTHDAYVLSLWRQKLQHDIFQFFQKWIEKLLKKKRF